MELIPYPGRVRALDRLLDDELGLRQDGFHRVGQSAPGTTRGLEAGFGHIPNDLLGAESRAGLDE